MLQLTSLHHCSVKPQDKEVWLNTHTCFAAAVLVQCFTTIVLLSPCERGKLNRTHVTF